MSRWSELLRGLVWRAGPFGFPFGVLLPLAVLGLVARRSAVPPPVWLFLLLFSLTITAFFVSARFRLVLIPALAAAAAGGAVQLGVWIRERNGRALGIAAIAGAALVALITLPGPFAQERVDLEPELDYAVGYGHYRAARWSEAEGYLARATALRPDYPEAHNILGIVLYRQNRLREAVEQFRTSARLDPAFTDVQSSLRVVAEDRAANLAEAWRLATAEDPQRRDGARAVYHANRAAALTVEPDPCVMGGRRYFFRTFSLSANSLRKLAFRTRIPKSKFLRSGIHREMNRLTNCPVRPS